MKPFGLLFTEKAKQPRVHPKIIYDPIEQISYDLSGNVYVSQNISPPTATKVKNETTDSYFFDTGTLTAVRQETTDKDPPSYASILSTTTYTRVKNENTDTD